MERVLAGVDLSVALLYLDDILVHVKAFDDHLLNLRVVVFN